ncbi:hypothetical protein KI387_037790, partial [Taxus chinensis]
MTRRTHPDAGKGEAAESKGSPFWVVRRIHPGQSWDSWNKCHAEDVNHPDQAEIGNFSGD